MRYRKFFSNFCLLIMILSLLIHPQVEVFAQPYEAIASCEEDERAFSYDAVLDLIEQLEEGDLENRCSLKDIEKINHLVILLARQGVCSADDDGALEEDITDLLETSTSDYAYSFYQSGRYSLVPAIFYGQSEAILCKSFLKKVKHFVKKHKKAIIIGTAVVVAAVVIVGVVAAVSTAAGAGASAAASSSNSNEGKHYAKEEKEPVITINTQDESLILQPAIQEQICLFKENFVGEQFLQLKDSKFSQEENGRILGQVFAHQFLDNISQNTLYDSRFYQEYTAIKIDESFSQSSSSYYSLGKESLADGRIDFYQLRGERALELQCYDQAIFDFGKVIEYNPTHSQAYLERATAHLGAKDYESSWQDYQQYVEKRADSLSDIFDFSLAFAKEFPIGVKDSGQQLISFASDCIFHPIDTATEVALAFGSLSKLVYSEEWAVIGQALAPEVYELVCNWETLSVEEQGRLSGYALGKYGMDIFIPGASAKLLATGVSSAKEIAAVCRTLKTAKKSLALEAVAQSGDILYTSTAVGANALSSSVPRIESLLEAGRTMDRAGLTKAGRALAKHGNRDITVFPKPVGTAVQINEQGQNILKEIVSDPQAVSYPNRFGGQDIFAPSGRGARFDDKDNLMGFLQPRRSE